MKRIVKLTLCLLALAVAALWGFSAWVYSQREAGFEIDAVMCAAAQFIEQTDGDCPDSFEALVRAGILERIAPGRYRLLHPRRGPLPAAIPDGTELAESRLRIACADGLPGMEIISNPRLEAAMKNANETLGRLTLETRQKRATTQPE